MNTRVSEIEAREKAATAGPWYWEFDAETKAIVIFQDGGNIVLTDGECLMEADADFIVQARRNIPYLLAQLKEAKKQKGVWPTLALLAFQHVVGERDEARGKLEAVGAWADDEESPLDHETDFRPHYDDPDFECIRCRLDRILKGASDG